VRRLRACHFTNHFEYAPNALAARRIVHRREKREERQREGGAANGGAMEEEEEEEEEDDDDAITEAQRGRRDGDDQDHEVAFWLSFPGVMFDDKWSKVLECAPQLMLYLTGLHAAALRPGGAFPRQPDVVTEWTSAAIASAATKNPIQAPMRESYRRCPCVLKMEPSDPMCPTVDDLELRTSCTDPKPSGVPCPHFIKMVDVRKLLNTTSQPGDKRKVLQIACGTHRPTSHAGQEMLNAKVRELRCFVVSAEKDKKECKKNGEPGLNDVPIALTILAEATGRKHGKVRNVIRGLIRKDEVLPPDELYCGADQAPGAPAPAMAAPGVAEDTAGADAAIAAMDVCP